MRFLIAQLNPGSLSGRARLRDEANAAAGPIEEWEFTSATGLFKSGLGYQDLNLLIFGAADFARQMTFAAAWPGDSGAIVHAEDAAYLFDHQFYGTLDSLEQLAAIIP